MAGIDESVAMIETELGEARNILRELQGVLADEFAGTNHKPSPVLSPTKSHKGVQWSAPLESRTSWMGPSPVTSTGLWATSDAAPPTRVKTSSKTYYQSASTGQGKWVYASMDEDGVGTKRMATSSPSSRPTRPPLTPQKNDFGSHRWLATNTNFSMRRSAARRSSLEDSGSFSTPRYVQIFESAYQPKNAWIWTGQAKEVGFFKGARSS